MEYQKDKEASNEFQKSNSSGSSSKPKSRTRNASNTKNNSEYHQRRSLGNLKLLWSKQHKGEESKLDVEGTEFIHQSLEKDIEQEIKNPVWDGENLLNGEKLLFAYRCFYVPKNHSHKKHEKSLSPGMVYFSNFRCFFEKETYPKNILFFIPLRTIYKIKYGKKSQTFEDFVVKIYGKDLQVILFAFKDQQTCVRFLARLSSLSFGKEEAFAYSFQYHTSFDGWSIYNPQEDFKRMNVPNSQWRITKINENFELSKSYPQLLAVPAQITDEQLKKIGAFRSKGRIPVCIWLHSKNGAALLRSSQPMVGMTRSRCVQDEQLLDQIRLTNVQNSKYLYILDSRPKVNAQANSVKGMGYELTSSIYTQCQLEFFDIPNIHVMRESLQKLAKFFRTVKSYWSPQEPVIVNWLEHIRKLLACSSRIAFLIEKEGASALIHCSDGWDRTAQTVALAEILLDPFYRTVDGFCILIQKEFLSFGHKIAQRSGHDQGPEAKNKEQSPILLQFIDAVFQLVLQFPTSFEFNSFLLLTIMDHLHSCLFGTFLMNCEKERKQAELSNKCVSLWSFIHDNKSLFMTSSFIPDSQVLFPDVSGKKLQLWREYYVKEVSDSYERLKQLFTHKLQQEEIDEL